MVRLGGDFNLSKIFLSVILVIIFFIFFFPIKMAVNEKDIKSLNNLEYYIIKPTGASGGFWVGYNDRENEIYFINLNGNSFENDLGISILGDFNTVRIKNKFVVYGKKNMIIKKSKSYDINVTKWDIVAPIKRGSLYGLVASSKYLTLWDFINKIFD